MCRYTQEMFIADLGGIYGFVLGISIITLLEFFDWVLIRVPTLHCTVFTPLNMMMSGVEALD